MRDRKMLFGVFKSMRTWCVALFLGLSLAAFAGEPFHFAVLSDVHIDKNLTKPTEDLQQCVDQINKTADIDFTLVTGDIADNGDGASMRIAKGVLDKLQKPYYIILGNHDTKWSESGVMDFKRIFGYERFNFEYKGYIFLGFNTGPIIRMTLGHVAPDDIDWVKQQLENNGVNGKPVFLVTHYPLLPGDVDNWYDLTDAVRKYPVKAFLGGHYHSYRYFQYDGIPGILNRSSLRGNGGTGYTEYDMTPDSMLVYEHKVGQPRQRKYGLSLTKQYYSAQPGSDSLRPNYRMNEMYPQVKADWTTESRVGMYSGPAMDNRCLYVGDNLGQLTCYNRKNGFEVWKFHCSERIIGQPGVAEGVVVFGSVNNTIYGVDAKTGKERWHIDAGAPVMGAVRIVNGIAYIGASDHCMRAIRVNDGKVVWKYDQVKGYIETLPLVTSDKVVFGAWDNTLYALNKADGRLAWKWVGFHPGLHYSPGAVWPVTANGKVFIADPQRALTAIRLNEGTTVWRTLRSMVRETAAISADGKRVYSKTMQDSVVCYSATAEKPVEVWATNVGFGYEIAPTMPVEKDGVVFGGTMSGIIYALDGKTGHLFWKYKIGNTMINAVVPISRHELYFTNFDGTVGRLKIDSSVYKLKK
jgi:outer membrane protein assembly factor BamB/predicted phosphodiesterase